MKYMVVLNGCSDSFISQAEEIHGFLSANGMDALEGNALILYCDENKKEELTANCPAASLRLVKVARYQPENVLECLKQLEKGRETEIYLFPGDYAGSELSVRFACRMKGCSLVGANRLDLDGEKVLCYKEIYSNHMLGEFELHKRPCCISIAKGCSDRKTITGTRCRTVSEIDMTKLEKDGFIKRYELTEEKAAGGLEHARFILAIGRGVQKKETVEKLRSIAKEIGAELGVSRPVAMDAWVPMSRLIGVSGTMTKPEICIAAGVSGAAAFFAGIEKSKWIIAVNTDKKAPIIHNADVVVVDDFEPVLEELMKIIKASK